MAYMPIIHDEDPREKILKDLGDISGFEIFNNKILVAVYIRPNKTKLGGIDFHLSSKTLEEDPYQSKVGLLVARGPAAFADDSGQWFQDVTVNNGDWLVHRSSDGWSITVNGVLCRILSDTQTQGRVDIPDRVW